MDTTTSKKLTTYEKDMLSIELGDILLMKARKHIDLHERYCLVEYIDDTQIHLLLSPTEKDEKHDMLNSLIILRLDDGVITNYEIEAIQIIYRQEHKGYARQNNFTPGKWIKIEFGGDVPAIINGEITDIEEDMIEIKTYPDNAVIYLDFKYQGIPLAYKILKIALREPPSHDDKTVKPHGEMIDSGEDKDSSIVDIDQQSVYSVDDDVVHPLSEKGIMQTQALLKANIEDGDNILDGMFIEEDLDVEVEVLIDDDKRRVDLDTQLNDLLNALKSKIPSKNISNQQQKRIHTIISRFRQLREQFSLYDSEENRLRPIRKGANYKPLVNKLKQLEDNIGWLYPVVSTHRKLYQGGEGLDDSDKQANGIVNENISTVLKQDEKIQDEYNKNKITEDTNKYEYMIKQQNKLNEPYVNSDYNSEKILKTIKPGVNAENGIETFINNYSQRNVENFAPVIKNNGSDLKLDSKRFVIQRYNLGTKTITKQSKHNVVLKNITDNEEIPVQSFITMPKQFMETSKVRLPESSIYDKIKLSVVGWKNWKVMKPKTNINTEYIDKDTLDAELTDELRKNRVKEMMTQMKQFILDSTIEDDDKYDKLLDYFIPRTRDIIEVITETTNKYNMQDVLEELQPFHIYKDDISFKQYMEIINFLQNSIFKLKQTITQNIRTTRGIGKFGETELKYKPIYFTLAITYADILTQLVNNEKNISNNEFLRMVNEIDGGRILSDILTVINSDLYSDIDVKQTVENAINMISTSGEMGDTKEDGKETMKQIQEECENAILAKMYSTKEELSRDNGKAKIFVDKQYDTTRYEFGEEYQKEKAEMTELDYMDFLTNRLIEIVGMKPQEATIEARSIIDGRRTVRTGNYAILPIDGVDEEGKPKSNRAEYYKWDVSNKWIYDAKLTNMIMKNIQANPDQDMTKVFCNMKDKCILNNDETCTSLEDNKTNMMKDSYKEILKALSNEVEETNKMMKPRLEEIVSNTFKKFKELVRFRQYLFTENTIKHYNYGTQLVKYDIVISPYASIRDRILGDNGDKGRQMTNIMRFYKEFTQPPIVERGDDMYWFYCKTTQTKLLPSFFVDLATTYINGEDVSVKLLEIVRERGQHVDNMIVDKHSGYVIRMIDMDTDEGYNEQGYKIITKEILEHKVNLRDDDDDALAEVIDEKEDDVMTKEDKIIYNSTIGIIVRNILNAFSVYIGISVEKYTIYIIQEVRSKILQIIKSKKHYEAVNKKLAEKGKKTIPYETKRNELIVMFSGLYYLFAIQTSIPHLKTKKTFPGCNRDFDGIPMYDGNTGLYYIACVMKKISSSQEPWNSIRKMKETIILQRMTLLYTKFMEGTTDINNKITEKENYIKQIKDEHPDTLKDIYEHSMQKWHTFQPFLLRHGKESELIRPREIRELLKSDLKRSLKSGTKRGTEIQNIMYGSLHLNATHIYNEINKLVQKEGILLTTKAGDGYLENGCCSVDMADYEKSKTMMNPIQYFLSKSENLETYMKNTRSVSSLLTDIKRTKIPYKLVVDIDTKLKYPHVSKDVISEETIYRAFIRYCRFNTGLPIPKQLQHVCNVNKSKFNDIDDIDTKIEVMKNEGLIYSTKSFQALMQAVNREKLTYLFSSKSLYSRENPIMYDIFKKLHSELLVLESKSKLLKHKHSQETIIDEEYETIGQLPLPLSVMNTKIQHMFMSVFEMFDEYEPTTHETKENREALISLNDDFYNYIDIVNKSLTKQLNVFLKDYGNTKKSVLKKIIEYVDTIDTITTQPNTTDKYTYVIHNMKHTIYLLSKLYPSIILNKSIRIEKEDGIESDINLDIPNHWRLSNLHKHDIKTFLIQTYSGISTFYTDTIKQNISIVLDESKILLDYIEKIPIFIDSEYYEIDETKLTVIDLTHKFFGMQNMSRFLKFVILCILTRYISLGDTNKLMLMEKEEGLITEVDIVEGNMEKSKGEIASFIIYLLEKLHIQKKHINYNRQEILDLVFKVREREKDTKTRRLKELTDEERKVDNELKKAKLGAWNKGLQKGLYSYVAKNYDEERIEMEKEALLDAKMNKHLVTNMNKEIYKIEILEHELTEMDEDKEAYDMSDIVDDDDYDDDMGGDDDGYRLKYEQTFSE